MKILFVVQSLKKAGAERMLVNICNQLVKDRKNQVAIFLMKEINEFQGELSHEVVLTGGNSEIQFSIIKKSIIKNESYIEFISNFKPDIIHSHLFHADIFAHTYFYKDAVYVSHLQNSTVAEYSGFIPTKILSKSMWTNFYEYCWILKRYRQFKTNFIACSAGAFQLHKDRIRIGKIITLPNASPLPESILPKELTKKKLHLIWIGRFTDVKRPQLAIQIAKLLKGESISFTLKMLGVGDEFENCKQMIYAESLSNNVQLCGLIDDMQTIYSDADIVLHTSKFEGLPLVFTEASVFGIPIVSSDCMPNNEFLKNRYNGLILKSNDPKDFANVIIDLMNNPTLYHEMSTNAIALSRRFGMENYINNLCKFYTDLLSDK